MEFAAAGYTVAQGFGEGFQACGVERGRLAPVSYQWVGLHFLPVRRLRRLNGFRGGVFRGSLFRNSFERSSIGELERQLPPRDALVVFFVSAYDALHQAVPNHVPLVELNERNAFDALQYLDGVEQAGAPAVGEVYLGDVAGYDHFRVEALARKHHFHLLGSTVLRFVEDYEAVVESAAAHEGERRDFDRGAFEQLFHFVGFEHVIERIVEGAKVWIDFFLQTAREEAEFFARFDGGARQNDAGDALADEGLNRHRDGKISLAGTGRADAENEVVTLDSFEIAALGDSLGSE